MREETIDVAEKQPLVKVPVEEFGADVLEEIVAMEEPAEEMVETILEDKYFVTEESKSVQEVTTSQEPDYMELLAELQSRFICLQYEFQYNLDKISEFNYEHRYRNLQKDLKKMYKEQIETIFQSMDFGRLVLRRRCNYRTWTKIEVMKEVFGFDKIERGLLHIVVQSSHIS